jgi:uncharacterized membrane protein
VELAGLLPKRKKRLSSIDLLRGSVMVIMALDHVRDYFHRSAFIFSPTDLAQSGIILFFTRWVTHFCAPVFVFLAGAAAYLYGMGKSKNELSRFLLKRGVWLLFVEFFICTLEWTFNPSYPAFFLQVIWAIGISMIALSGLIRLSPRIILGLAVLLIAGHNCLDNIHFPGSGPGPVGWAALHDPGDYAVGPFRILIRYSVLPWIGVMAAGYCLGPVFTPEFDARARFRILRSLGTAAILLFIILRSGNFYGDPAHWSVQKNLAFDILSFLNVTKYPPSLQYILVTLGPSLLFLAYAEKPLNAVSGKIAVFGRVPLFYYLAHLFLIHVFAVVGVWIAGHPASDMILNDRVNRVAALKGYGFSLPVVYAVWIAVVLLLYPACRWFDKYKRKHSPKKWWLTYL